MGGTGNRVEVGSRLSEQADHAKKLQYDTRPKCKVHLHVAQWTTQAPRAPSSPTWPPMSHASDARNKDTTANHHHQPTKAQCQNPQPKPHSALAVQHNSRGPVSIKQAHGPIEVAERRGYIQTSERLHPSSDSSNRQTFSEGPACRFATLRQACALPMASCRSRICTQTLTERFWERENSVAEGAFEPLFWTSHPAKWAL